MVYSSLKPPRKIKDLAQNSLRRLRAHTHPTRTVFIQEFTVQASAPSSSDLSGLNQKSAQVDVNQLIESLNTNQFSLPVAKQSTDDLGSDPFYQAKTLPTFSVNRLGLKSASPNDTTENSIKIPTGISRFEYSQCFNFIYMLLILDLIVESHRLTNRKAQNQ